MFSYSFYLFLLSFFFFFFPIIWHHQHRYKYQGFKITSEEVLESYQEPRTTLLIACCLQTSCTPILQLTSTWNPRTTDTQTFALKHFQSSQCHHMCFVPDSMFMSDHVITTLETILRNIYDQATVHNS